MNKIIAVSYNTYTQDIFESFFYPSYILCKLDSKYILKTNYLAKSNVDDNIQHLKFLLANIKNLPKNSHIISLDPDGILLKPFSLMNFDHLLVRCDLIFLNQINIKNIIFKITDNNIKFLQLLINKNIYNHDNLIKSLEENNILYNNLLLTKNALINNNDECIFDKIDMYSRIMINQKLIPNDTIKHGDEWSKKLLENNGSRGYKHI